MNTREPTTTRIIAFIIIAGLTLIGLMEALNLIGAPFGVVVFG